MNKKVGILNFQHSDQNYGAVLQAAALQRVVENNGYSSEHINLIPKDHTVLKMFLQEVKKFIKLKLNLIESPPKNSEIFENFRKQYIKRTISKYHNEIDLNNEVFKYDAVIVGSDQVWRPPTANNLLESYFLSFISDEVKKISYAASFGVDYWPKKDDIELTNKIKNLVNRFDAVSVREDSGVDICKRYFEVDATHVLDPVLLVGEVFFNEIIDSNKNTNEFSDIVYYKLDIDDEFLNFVDNLSKDNNYSLENIYYVYKEKNRYYNTVHDWLAKLKNSNLVITDSFHATCFAILFNKEFICISNERRGLARLESLLKMLKIENRLFNELDVEKIKLTFKNKIAYKNVNKILEEKRKESLDFLISALDK